MITRKPKPSKPNTGAGAGQIAVHNVEILVAVRAEIVAEGKHEMRELNPGDVVQVPIWSARDLIARGKAKYA